MIRCIKYNEEKPITEFSKNKSKKYGLQAKCKTCTCEYEKEYYKKNKDKRKEYYKKNKDKIKEYKKEYYKKNKDKIKKYREKNKDKIKKIKKKYDKEYREKNKDKIKKIKKKCRKEQSDKLHDVYIKQLIITNSTLTAADISSEFIELKREQITIHRLLKESKNGIT